MYIDRKIDTELMEWLRTPSRKPFLVIQLAIITQTEIIEGKNGTILLAQRS
jgi:hypothetical protein